MSYEQGGAAGPRWEAAGLVLRGFGLYYPEEQIVNSDVAAVPGNAIDASVLGTVSVRSRHRSSETETVQFMAAEAGKAAVKDAGLEPTELDLLVLSNWTTPPFTPEYGPEVAALIGSPRTLAFDISGACVGFLHGVQTAAAYLHCVPEARHALVVCSEQFSRRVRPGSKGELVTSDAAGAVVLSKSDRGGLIDVVLHSDGSRADVIRVAAPRGWIRSQSSLPDHAVTSIVESCAEILRRTGVTMDEIDWVVPHPGTDVVHRRVRAALEVPEEKFIVNFETRGNTSSASIPIVLAEEIAAGRFRPGDLVLSPAIGAGWYSGAMLYRIY
ncbi:ketoacyl-ACP synthase III [Amycolatopsis granulosa]|uniref:ketoacyl-ACP synthase III n=1 Tax=Amycolatopsis granulosa TaxID=185684 RepID=UPI0014219E47|nr:ketoacyl-ACP synthase III [Amycolatopsis granulosa]NIH85755.1 3-oxoacyl-[acyl-carrier-protein] synthase-3 [Amycolatopsis granulosa]